MKEIYSFKEKLGEKEYNIILKKPSRVESEEIEIFHAAIMSAYMNAGVQTIASVDKYYSDNVGGPMPKTDEKELIELRRQLYKKEEELIKATIGEEDKMKLYQEIVDLNEKIRSFNSYYSQIYENTAETKARNKTIDFCLLNFSYYQEGDGEIKKLFPSKEENPRKRMIKQFEEYEKLEEGENGEFWSKAIDKLIFGFTIWYLNAAENREDFDTLFKGSFTKNKDDEKSEGSDENEPEKENSE